jgi:uncharacterized protein (TIGR04255 family)
MRNKSASTTRVKFSNAPINELVIAIYYAPLYEFKAQHIGMFWDTIRDRHPICEQQPPISFFGLQSDASGEIFPLPRFWFHSGQGTPLVQIQRDAFIFNWRSDGTNKYPHYDDVKKQFVVEFTNYRTFIQDVIKQELNTVNRYELTYINIISENELWKEPADIGKLFPPLASLSSIHRDTRKLVGLNSISTYQVNENLLVDSIAKLGKRTGTQRPVAILELKAHGAGEGLSVDEALAWYDTAHDATHDMFLNFTDESMRLKIWKPINAKLR